MALRTYGLDNGLPAGQGLMDWTIDLWPYGLDNGLMDLTMALRTGLEQLNFVLLI
jgi:hypothetical protein